MLHTKAAGRAPSIVVGSPSLGTTPRNIDLARGSIASSLAGVCRVSISVVVDDVAVLVYFQHGLELGVDDDVHDCLCTKTIVVIEYVGFAFRGRLSLASSLC